MEFLQGQSAETTVAIVVVAAGAAFLLRSKKSKGCLDPEYFKEFKLVEKRQLSHNVAKFKFALLTPTSVLGLPIGQHISCRGLDAAGEEVIKPYTPTTLDSDLGYFELVIKMYPQGRMSHHFREMKVGDYLSVKGPKGRFKYQPGQVKAFGMLAGGSGITPMFQVTRAILENPNDNTKVHLIYANVTYEDILLKEELESMAKNYPDRFKIYYVLNQEDNTGRANIIGAHGATGLVLKFINKEFVGPRLTHVCGKNDCPNGLEMLNLRRTKEVLPTGTSLTIVGEAIKDAAGTIRIQRPQRGPFYVSPESIDKIIAGLEGSAWCCHFVSMGFAVFGVCLFANHILNLFLERNRWREWRKRVPVLGLVLAGCTGILIHNQQNTERR